MEYEQHIFLGLGSNISNRYKHLMDGISSINNHPHLWVVNRSNIYESAPMYNINQRHFYNMVIQIETNLDPIDLLNELKKIEEDIGRKKTNKKNMPRVLDIDILAFGSLEINTNILMVPHPKISERMFVLKPWNDIAPNFKIKKFSSSIKDLFSKIKIQHKVNDIRMLLILGKEKKSD